MFSFVNCQNEELVRAPLHILAEISKTNRMAIDKFIIKKQLIGKLVGMLEVSQKLDKPILLILRAISKEEIPKECSVAK